MRLPAGLRRWLAPSAAEPVEEVPSAVDRRLWRLVDRVVLASVLSFVIATLALPLVGARVFHAGDYVMAFAPWKSSVSTNFAPSDPCLLDTVDAGMPAHAYVNHHLYDGEFALWQPFESGGSPLASVPNAAIESPTSLPYFVLPPWLAPGYVQLLIIVISVGGMYLLARAWGLTGAAGLLGGLTFVTSGFMTAWSNYPQIATAAFIPLLFWSLERLVTRPNGPRVVIAALVVASMVLGGFPAVLGWSLYAGAAYVIVRGISLRPGWRNFVVAGAASAAGVLLGAALTAYQLLPFRDLLNQVNLDYRQQVSSTHLPYLSLATTLVPRIYGTCAHGLVNYWAPRGSALEPESFAGFGSVALLIALLGATGAYPRRLRSVRGFFIGLGAVVVVLTYFGGRPLGFAQKFPVFNNNPVFRLQILLDFALAVLVTLGVSVIQRIPLRRRSIARLAIVTGAVIVALLAAGYLIHDARNTVPQEHLAFADRQILFAIVAAGVALIAVAVAGLWRRSWVSALTIVVLTGLVTAQSAKIAGVMWPEIPRSHFYPVTATHRFLQANLGHDRFASDDETLVPGTNAYYDLRSVNGHIFITPQWSDLLQTIDRRVVGGGLGSPTHPIFPASAMPVLATSPSMDRLSVRYLVVSPEYPVFGSTQTISAPASAPHWQGQPLTASIPGGRIRAVGIWFAEPFSPHNDMASVHVTVTDATGHVIATGSRRLYEGLGGADAFPVAVAGLDRPNPIAGPLRATFTMTQDASAPTVQLTSSGAPVVSIITAPANDNIRLAYAGDTVIYQRLHALPRVRWATAAHVETNPRKQIAIVNTRRPATEVLLDRSAPAPSGAPATLDVLEDSSDVIRTRVDAGGAGYLVVADALQHGWIARIDGKSTKLVPAEHAMVAVAVPKGRHVVTLVYQPAGLRPGYVVSALAIIGALLLWWFWRPEHDDMRES